MGKYGGNFRNASTLARKHPSHPFKFFEKSKRIFADFSSDASAAPTITYAHTSHIALHYGTDERTKFSLIVFVGGEEPLKHFSARQVNPSTVESVRRVSVVVSHIHVLQYLPEHMRCNFNEFLGVQILGDEHRVIGETSRRVVLGGFVHWMYLCPPRGEGMVGVYGL